MYDQSTHKVFSSRDVIFHKHTDKQIKEDEHNVWRPPYDNFKLEEEVVESTQAQEHLDILEDMSWSQIPQRSDEGTPQRRRRGEGNPQCNEPLRRSTRQIQAPTKYKYYALMSQLMTIFEHLNYEPYKDHKEWVDAMKEEYDSIMKNETWELIELPENKVPIGSKWLYKTKFNANGSIDKYKARLVAKGYSQK